VIDPGAIPEFTGDLAQLECDARALTKNAHAVRTIGRGVDHEFAGLSAYYHAPEAEQLFAATRPVRDRADGFATELEAVSRALDDYAAEVRPIVKRLERLKTDAATFVADCGDGDDWTYDGDKIQHNSDLMHDVDAAVAAFWDAERRAANKITGLVHGTHWVADDGSHKKGMYGYAANALDHAEKTPWGSVEAQKHHWYDVGHWLKSFVWDGFVVDGVWATVRGLGSLAGADGWDAVKKSWTGLGKLAIGIGPGPIWTATLLATPDRMLPGALRSGEHAAVDTGKAFVAWDEWGKNPCRAAGAVTFNALTSLATDGAGPTAKSGSPGKALGAVGRVGRTADPMTYAAKAGGLASKGVRVGALRLGDAMAKLHSATSTTAHIPNAPLHLPNNHTLHPNGTLTGPDNTPTHHPIPHEPSPTNPHLPHASADIHQPELAEGGAPGPGHSGSAHDVPPEASHGHGPSPTHDGPKPEMTPTERAAHDAHLRQIERSNESDFDKLKDDPDHRGKVKPSEMDEARVALDLRDQGKVPADIQRPPGANQGDLYSPSSNEYYDIKGVHSDWPPLNNVRDKSLPFKGAYDPANNQRWVDKLEDQIVDRHRIVILDMRNANQAAIDDVKAIIESKGWGDRVVWYP
jgi:hypothetical protein